LNSTIDLIESRAGENAPLKASAKRRSTAGLPLTQHFSEGFAVRPNPVEGACFERSVS
jgi:hypothetical protein